MEKFQKFFAVMLLGLLQLAVGQVQANAQSPTGSYSVTVTTPGTFGQVMLQTVENWTDVVDLTVSGHLNDFDLAYLSRMLNITKLDLSNTDITTISGCNGLSKLRSIVLPTTVTIIEDNAFSGCTSLSSFALNNIEIIGAYAFKDCGGLTGTLSGVKVKTINSRAFSDCNHIEEISFPVVEEIGNYAFDGCSLLTNVYIPEVKRLGAGAFSSCSKVQSIHIAKCTYLGEDDPTGRGRGGCFRWCSDLNSVILSDELEIIPYETFSRCEQLKSIKLPSNLKVIGDNAFESTMLSAIDIPEGVKSIGWEAFSCPLETVGLPSTLETVASNAFLYSDSKWNSSTGAYSYSYYLNDVYCKSVVPILTSAFNNDMVKAATLHVPSFSVSAYKLDDNWYKFNKIEAIDGNLTDVTINNTFTIIDYSGLSDNANLTLTSSASQNIAAHLTISGGNTLSLNDYIQYQDFNPGMYRTTLITNNEVRANNITTRLLVPTNEWSFISMPYDVNVSSIVVPEGTLWVIRRYNGANRAAMSGDTWENVTSGQTLNAGEGYILHCINGNSDSWRTEYVEFAFPAVNNSTKNNLFTHNDVIKTIEEYPAEFSHNRGWNLIGNPYPSYMRSHYVDFPAPITVWNGRGYTAYSLADDDYVMRPNEAFFMQCPVNTNQIKFNKEGRTHDYNATSSNSYNSRAGIQSTGHRSILNVILSDENYSDRTRIVLNEAASYGYEIDKDASKFMSDNESVPQIYIIDNGINYAINERPLGIGVFSLGVRTGKNGTYKISLDTKMSDYDVLLIDNETNHTANLNKGDYPFESNAQTSNDRFSIRVNVKGGQSSIEDITDEAVGFSVNGNKLSVDKPTSVVIYSIDGKLIQDGVVDGCIELRQGIYLLSINNSIHKIAIK